MEILQSTIVIPYRDLKPNPKNPRIIKDHKFDQLVQSLCEFPDMLYKRPIVAITDNDDKYMVLGGNMRLKAIAAAKKKLQTLIINDHENENKWRKNWELLEKGVPVVLADDWSEEQRNEFVIKDNISYGEHDWELLANEWNLENLIHWGLDIPDVNVKVPDPIEDDYTPILPADPITKIGDIYELNGHRLMCGDSRDRANILELTGCGEANLLFTSPPYWVGKDYETEKSEEEIDEFIADIAKSMVMATSADLGRIVINTGTSSINRIERKRKVEILFLIDKWANCLKKNGWLARHMRIWVKRGQLPAVISPKTDVIDQHNEFIIAFEKEWSQIVTFWEPNGDQRGQERLGTPWAQQGVWDDIHGQKSADGQHEAAFPVEIPFRNILLYTKRGEIVTDLFAGSGTTLIACEQLGRFCRLMEISPGYCDIIIDRYVKFMSEHGYSFTIKRNGEIYNPIPLKTA